MPKYDVIVRKVETSYEVHRVDDADGFVDAKRKYQKGFGYRTGTKPGFKKEFFVESIRVIER